MRVLIIRNAYQQDAGGAEQYALNLAIALKNVGHIPILVTKVREILKKSSSQDIATIKGRWNDAQGWSRSYYLRYPAMVIWYIYIILRHRIDIVHPQCRDDFVFATSAARILRKRVIWTDHADLKYVLDNKKHYNPRMRRWVIKTAHWASAITISSRNEKKEIEAVAPDMPSTILVYNGVFIDKSVVPVPKTNKLIIGTNARLVSAKGISELLEGFAALQNKDVDLWLLGGDSGNKPKYEKQARDLGITNKVKFLGYLSSPNDVVATMDIFVHASYHEAFSLALIEAAMLGRPIVATRVGGTPEIIDDSCGVLIEPKSPKAITSALEILISDRKLRDKLGKEARKKAIENFDFQKIVENKILPLYIGVHN